MLIVIFFLIKFFFVVINFNRLIISASVHMYVFNQNYRVFMKQSLMVYSATRGNVDGTNYASVWAGSEEEKKDADTIGKPPMKINCERDIIDTLRGKIPGMVECELKMISAAGAKGGLFISSVVVPAVAFVPTK